MTYLFDLGNVLLAFDFIPALKALTGTYPEQDAISKLLEKKDAFESGKLSIEEYVIIARELLDYRGSDAHFFETWNSIFTKIPDTFQLAESLKKQGHRLILFSNISPIHAHHCLETYKLMEIFDDAVFSYEMGAIKPENAFFTNAFEAFQIDPSETIYIDDLPANIAAGKRHGLRSFCYDYNKHQDLLEWLNEQPVNE